jgi:uncharacterized protein (TIGR02453 family)
MRKIMTTENRFQGFSPKAVKFFADLKKHNSREWFNARKETYTSQVMDPARSLVTDLGDRLKEIAPDIIAVPKFNRSIFRIYRDTRFSPDKSPYKTHLGLFFWEGLRPRMECAGFYFHLEPPNLILGGGLYMFPRKALEHYRNAVTHPEYGAELADIVDRISGLKGYSLGGKHYKRIPAGFDAAHPNAELLLHNGLYTGTEAPIPEELYSERLLDYCMERYTPLVDLHRWLVEFNTRIF